jgi:hypothetical protein
MLPEQFFSGQFFSEQFFPDVQEKLLSEELSGEVLIREELIVNQQKYIITERSGLPLVTKIIKCHKIEKSVIKRHKIIKSVQVNSIKSIIIHQKIIKLVWKIRFKPVISPLSLKYAVPDHFFGTGILVLDFLGPEMSVLARN